MKTEAAAVAEVAEQYYDSDDADRFYFNIWGGEDIHIGLYESPRQSVREASRATVERMADQLEAVKPSTHILDIGAGYGGAARYLARRFGCRVTCLNLSETQNRRNVELTRSAGLEERVHVVHGNFEALPFADNTFDVVWSQDAILHSGDRARVLGEVARVLRRSGEFLFTDPMQAEDCPSGVLQAVLSRIHLDSLGSVPFYREQLSAVGFGKFKFIDLTPQLARHYGRVHEELSARYTEMIQLVSKQYAERMLAGLQRWVDAGNRGHLSWGILRAQLA